MQPVTLSIGKFSTSSGEVEFTEFAKVDAISVKSFTDPPELTLEQGISDETLQAFREMVLANTETVHIKMHWDDAEFEAGAFLNALFAPPWKVQIPPPTRFSQSIIDFERRYPDKSFRELHIHLAAYWLTTYKVGVWHRCKRTSRWHGKLCKNCKRNVTRAEQAYYDTFKDRLTVSLQRDKITVGS
jgi:hypothetical protein